MKSDICSSGDRLAGPRGVHSDLTSAMTGAGEE